ncbi:hypothetical protein AURDEDRAFT_164142 [Auricularia subglabra TFB-10046 SS5]|nr:hypothetical protein AURDEDRAFT_164142 [Auricularia subglabra TFB-10046 SS5]
MSDGQDSPLSVSEHADDELDSDDPTFLARGSTAAQPPLTPPLASVAGRAAWAPQIPPSQALPEDIWDHSALHTGSGWLRADYAAATFIFNAAYTAARYEGMPATRMDCNWHRPDEHDVQPLGYNARGDIAPREVHLAVSRLLEQHGENSRLVQKLAHGVADKVWFLHSRSVRLDQAVSNAFDFLPLSAQRALADMMRQHPLKDLRMVAATVDPRQKLVYGKTLDSAAAPRQWREIYFADRHHPDWDSDPGGITGSSPEATSALRHDGEVRYNFGSASDEERQFRRWADRRTRRLARSAQLAADRADQALVATEEILALQQRAETLREILERGVEAERGPLPLTETQTGRAWYDRRLRESAAALAARAPRPETP